MAVLFRTFLCVLKLIGNLNIVILRGSAYFKILVIFLKSIAWDTCHKKLGASPYGSQQREKSCNTRCDLKIIGLPEKQLRATLPNFEWKIA